MRKNVNIAGYLFIFPFGVIYTLFLIYPIFQGFFISLHDWDILGSKIFVGGKNYNNLLVDPKFWSSLWHTAYFALLTTPVLLALGLGLAMALNKGFRGRDIFRAIFFYPYMLTTSIVAVIWIWLYQPLFGLINFYLNKLGLPAHAWLAEAKWAMPAIAGATIWWTVGFNMILFLAGLQEIPDELHEAAQIDGASSIQRFYCITLPLLRRTVLLATMLQMIASFKVFGQVYIMTGGGPYGTTRVLVQYIYETGFQWYRMGPASAMAYIGFCIMLVFSLIQFKLFTRAD